MAKLIQERGDLEVASTEVRKSLTGKVAALARSEGMNPTNVDGLAVFRNTATGACYWTTYELRLTVFVQGRKLINLGGTEYLCDGSSFLVSSIDVPVQSEILEASESVPLLGMYLRLDMPAVHDVPSRDDLPESDKSPQQRTFGCRRSDGLFTGCLCAAARTSR